MAEKNYATDYCPAEIMAAFISRNLEGVRLAGIGAMSEIPFVAIRLAQATHSPDLRFMCGPAGVLGTRFNKVSGVGDYRMHLGGERVHTLDDVMNGFNDPRSVENLIFFGGFQIDKYGNVNMTLLGDPKRPKFRGPGTVGLMGMSFGWKVDLFTTSHAPRLFVEKVDFISGPGYLDGPGAREKAGCPPNSGPRYVITPLCIFDFDEETKVMRLKSVHPGHTVDEVLGRMSFTPIVPQHVPETEPPTVEEVAFMRAMDPEGILPRLTG